MKPFLRNNGLSLVLATLFLGFWGCQAVSGWVVNNDDRLLHHRPVLAFTAYLTTGHFWSATAENWESEFLQMSAYVVLTTFLYQKGSAESKDPDDPDAAVTGQAGFFYRNSLSLALLALFAISFGMHAGGSLIKENEMRLENNQSAESLLEFIGTSEFWFESFQNWQSEFLAVLSIVVLSIFLRQHGSPESKAVGDPNSKTGA